MNKQKLKELKKAWPEDAQKDLEENHPECKVAYTLLNKADNRRLIHPTVGLWFTNDLKEAEEMLDACKEYLHADGLDDLQSDFVIIDVESGEEITLLQHEHDHCSIGKDSQ